MLDTPTRMKLDLSGPWTYLRDGGQSGEVKVPSAYEFVDKVTFERKVALTPEDLETYQFHLVVFGVNYSTEIAINGDFVASHNGGYTSFIQPIQPNSLQVGPENLLHLTVTNQLGPRKTMPLRAGVWDVRNYGGLLRDIFLLATPRVYVKDVVYTSKVDETSGKVTLTAEVSLDGPDPQAGDVKGVPPGQLSCAFELVEKISGVSLQKSLAVPVHHAADGWQTVKIPLTLEGAKLWSPESPDLYLAKCYLIDDVDQESRTLDEYDQNIGLRSLDVHNGDFFLNGKRIVLRGVVWYEDHPSWGSSLPYEQMERDVVLMKSLGANAVRFAAHPPHPYMLNLCDRYGLLALVEMPVHAPSGVLADDAYDELASSTLREMIVRDRNHASVLAWGLGDDFGRSSDASRRFVETLAHQAKQLDDRPLYYSSGPRLADQCSNLVDFVILNSTGSDVKSFKTEVERWRSVQGEKPLVVRLGTEVQGGNKNGYTDPLSQQGQARFYLQRLETLRSLDYDGSFVWSFNDWRGDRPALTVHSGDPFLHSMGLVDGLREKRIAYEAVRSLYENEKFVALPAGGVSATAPIVYVLSGFVLLIALAYLYNTNRRFRESLNRSLFNSYNFFADVRDQRAVPIFHTTLLGLILAGASALVLSSFLLHFRENLFFDNLLSLLLVSDWVKVGVVRLVWNPLKFILGGGAVLFLTLIILSALLMFLRSILKTRVFVYHAYTLVVWSGAPLLILIPVGMILYRVMESSVYVLPGLILYGALHLWVFLRFLKGLSVVFDVRPLKVYLAGWVLALAFVGGLYLYYDVVYSGPMYLTYWYHTLVLGG